jgi:PKD repeat protein
MANVILAALKSGAPYTAAVAGIGRSTDAGATWAQPYTHASSVMGLCSTPSGIFGITYNGHLLKSTNIGAIWSDLGAIDAGATTCADIGYIGNNTLVVANGAGATSAFISTNLGTSWSALLSSPYVMMKVLDMGGGRALVLGRNGTSTGYEYKTSDYGASWVSVATIGSFLVNDAVHVGSGIVLMCGGENYSFPFDQIYRSVDYGDNWTLVKNIGASWWGITIGWLPSTNYLFSTLQQTNTTTDSNRFLYRSADLGLTWASLGNQGAMSLYGGTGSILYSGRTTNLCPLTPTASIKVSGDYAGTWSTTTGYDPARFLEVSSAITPDADFSASPVSGDADSTFNFSDLSLNAPTSWLYNFGDGSSSILQNPAHVYTQAGTFSPDMTATNSAGSDSTAKINYIDVNMVANFSATPTSGSSPLSVAFTDLSKGQPTSRLWDFGDGSTSTVLNPTHVYGSGLFPVSLTASNASKSDTETKANYISSDVVYWVAVLASNWDNTDNWSLTSGGPGGTPVPDVTKVVVFDSGGNGNCLIDTTVSVKSLYLISGFTGEIYQGGYPITVASNASFTGGKFEGGNGSISLKNFFLHGTYCIGTSGLMRVTGDFFFHEEPPVPIPPRINLDEFTLTPQNISDGYVLLMEEPDGTNIALNVIGGGSQMYGADFAVSSFYLTWTGYALDGILAPGDQLRALYLDTGDTSASVFEHNNGVVRMDASGNTLTAGGIRFHEFDVVNGVVDGTGALMIDGSCWAERSLSLQSGYLALNTDSTVHLLHDMTSYDGFGRHATGCAIQFDGTWRQSFIYNGGVVPTIVVDKADSEHVRMYGVNPVRVDGDVIVRNGTLDTNGLDLVVGS